MRRLRVDQKLVGDIGIRPDLRWSVDLHLHPPALPAHLVMVSRTRTAPADEVAVGP